MFMFHVQKVTTSVIFFTENIICPFCLAGALGVNEASLESGDALKIREEEELSLKAVQDCHLLLVAVARR
jgi:hypothetical protein